VDGHGGGHGGERRALTAALVLIGAFTVVEVVAGVLAGSLAVLADAGHMLSDVAALALALFASWLAGRPATPRRSFGFRRAEILAALANGAALVAIAIWIFIEAAQRFGDPPHVAGGWVLGVGAAGLAVNLAAAAVLRGHGGDRSLNVRAALRHVLADVLGSVGVLAAGAAVLAAGWLYADPVAGLVIGMLVLGSSWQILRESVGVLLEETPAGIDPEAVGRAMSEPPEVAEVHDLHIWTITTGFPALAAHVLCRPEADCHRVRRDLERLLHERFGLEHTTLQVDHVPSPSSQIAFGEASPRRTPLRGRG
jgi:cobalt-zinc-cadmium efflux system protein